MGMVKKGRRSTAGQAIHHHFDADIKTLPHRLGEQADCVGEKTDHKGLEENHHQLYANHKTLLYSVKAAPVREGNCGSYRFLIGADYNSETDARQVHLYD